MTYAEIQQMGAADIDKEIAKSKIELLKIKLQTSAQNSKETHKLKELRKHVARLKTAQNATKSN